jgi:DNA (cytosine-5)-methyltransferase 1
LRQIPVVDLFAGPGGLGEGFSSYVDASANQPFRVCISVEKEQFAHETLQLRAFFREFIQASVPTEYYSYISAHDIPSLYRSFPTEAYNARKIAVRAELGHEDWPKHRMDALIKSAIGKASECILVGGPPCQAYSIIGRSRNKGISGYDFAKDHRSSLYREYLQILADRLPMVFVMENVKGLLSASANNKSVLKRILADLSKPVEAVYSTARPYTQNPEAQQYVLYSLTEEAPHSDQSPKRFLVESEKYGIPQKRHRVVILGVRCDISKNAAPRKLIPSKETSLDKILLDLPELRSGLSRSDDSGIEWIRCLQQAAPNHWYSPNISNAQLTTLKKTALRRLAELQIPNAGRGGNYVKCNAMPSWSRAWYYDRRIGGAWNHQTKAHMPSDLHRYFFASSFAQVMGRSPKLDDFPEELLPEHRNVKQYGEPSDFSDRFRVQLNDSPATTITAHISKDGHYYIHPDPTQCRSLTVRECARIQTFPDNYFFCGPRTSQYQQVGNAVPPLLARSIAKIIHELLLDAGVLRG